MPTRRELLKYFGAGAVIAPVTAGAVQARLVEPARVELIKPKYGLKELPKPIALADITAVEMSLVMKDGTTRRATVLPWSTSYGTFPSHAVIASVILSEEFGGSPAYARNVGEVHGKAVLWP